MVLGSMTEVMVVDGRERGPQSGGLNTAEGSLTIGQQISQATLSQGWRNSGRSIRPILPDLDLHNRN